jgi:hypothetical protein
VYSEHWVPLSGLVMFTVQLMTNYHQGKNIEIEP